MNLKTMAMASLLAIVSPAVWAQTAVGVKQMINPVIVPQTSVKVVFTIKCEQIYKGPYARYAQQYLGISVPLNDKTVYTIENARLDYDTRSIPQKNESLSEFVTPENVEENNIPLFSDVSVDAIVYSAAVGGDDTRTTVREKNLDQMAADAANAIFTLRKRRFDLVTGEFGENVFGAGLGAAIEEMARIEDNYVSLFSGKKSVKTYEVTIEVTPSKNLDNIIVCRFSENGGIVDATDLSGEPVMLNMTAGEPFIALEGKSAGKGTQYATMPRMATCKLFKGMELLTSREIPMLQAGTIIEMTNVK